MRLWLAQDRVQAVLDVPNFLLDLALLLGLAALGFFVRIAADAADLLLHLADDFLDFAFDLIAVHSGLLEELVGEHRC